MFITMKKSRELTDHGLCQTRPIKSSNREGATLVVVLALLGLMMVIGFFAYSMASQQQANSEYFANTPRAKARNVADFDREALMNWALEQIIKGGPADLPHSALSGGRHALVPNMFGADLHPYSGTGYNLMLDSGLPVFDNNYDGSDDGTSEPWMNASPAANGGIFEVFNNNFDYTPDAPYTAPDFNNTFLAYRGYGLDSNNNPVLVVKPSYHRPEVLREDSTGRVKLFRDWMNDSGYSPLSMRANKGHKANDGSGFVTDRYFYNSGSVEGISTPFPFPDFDPVNNPNETWSEGVWALEAYDGSHTYSFGEWVFYSGTYFRVLVDSPTGPPVDGAEWKEYTQPYYSYDADPDGDGVKEAIWMDLDFPIQETPDGTRYFVPMYAITILDADGLVNLNAHGNINGVVDLTGGSVFGDDNADSLADFISKSNLGLSPSEVNPLWVFTATDADFNTPGDIASAKADHIDFFNRTPDTTTNQFEMANMEWWWANSVKMTFNAGNVEETVLGRYGDDGITDFDTLYASQDRLDYPQPGEMNNDDNGNTPVGISGETAVHPLDLRGAGDIYQTIASPNNGKTLNFSTDTPSKWLKYVNYSYPSYSIWDGDPGNGDDLDENTYAGLPEEELITQALIDEAYEMETDYNIWAPLEALNPDSQFDISENGPLQISDSDSELSSVTSRLTQLMPWNLSENNRAAEIRKNLTTHSSDIKARNATPSVNRAAEYDSGTNFPPKVSAYDSTVLDFTNSAEYLAMEADPFRLALRRWLEVELTAPGPTDVPETLLQRLMSLNHIVDLDTNGNPYLRRLTPHPESLDSTVVDTSWIADANNRDDSVSDDDGHLIYTGLFSTPQEQEFWARTDRQRMARDIYVLLYVLGHGNDVTGPFAIDPVINETDIAQFAINAVNQMDRDNVIDIFEFDFDLSNGWGLDDNPYMNEGGDRDLVYGLEAQELVLNEAYVVLTEQQPNASGSLNLNATEWNDIDRQKFVYIELKNTVPYSVNLDNGVDVDATGDVNTRIDTTDLHDNGVWRLKLEYDVNGTIYEEYLTIRKEQVIPAGDHYVILSSSYFNPGAATPDQWHGEMRVDVNYEDGVNPVDFSDNDPANIIAPKQYGFRFLDLATHTPDIPGVMQSDPSYFIDYDYVLTDNTGTPIGQSGMSGDPAEPHLMGSIPDDPLMGGEDLVADLTTITMTLERRMNTMRGVDPAEMDDLSLSLGAVSDNVWVEVDKFQIEKDSGIFTLDLDDSRAILDSGADVRTDVISKLTAGSPLSRERVEQLDRNDFNVSFDPLTDDVDVSNDLSMVRNTIGGENFHASTDLSTGYTIWQPHFDRDFYSPIELLSVPLYDPTELTDGILGGSNLGLHMDGRNTAGVNFFLDPVTGLAANRWYRLFGYVEIPRYDSNVDDPTITFNANDPDHTRLPGKINWNTVRAPEVLGALMDEIRLFTLDLTPNNSVYLPDANSEAARDWWVQFIQSRDQVWNGVTPGPDPVTGMYLPGMPGSRPFRDFSFVEDGDQSMEHTMLRQLPIDPTRRLFEVGSASDSLDYPIPQRLLAKMVNNSTNRSHVFFVFVQVDFFEAAEQSDGSIRIGGKLDDSPGYRSMFVVDRSKAFETLQGDDFSSDPNDRFTLRFGDDDFDWTDLVLHRLNIK
ncbi:hypothetical protein Pla110_35550 [Polystyrenella longa]|uniref:Uncharacterized protein n=1 Tax=Polystyrenella longa TaxID=2528007 RepID=A0A518CRG4_9PLAN|nr:hypothetical protein [Polystyrenella longa]QDU81805.1 hypothetical protein Pla110_35550 [Polystyrenella longa]